MPSPEGEEGGSSVANYMASKPPPKPDDLDDDTPASGSPGGADTPPPFHQPRAQHTKLQQASIDRRAPQPKGAPPPPPDPTWGEALEGGMHSFLPGLGEAARGVAAAATHPQETWDAIKNVGGGMASQLQGAMGFKQDAAKKAKDEQLAKLVEQPYIDTYAPLLHGDTSGFRRSLKNNSFQTLTDVASIAAPFAGAAGAGFKAASGAADAAGAAKLATGLAKTGKFVSKVPSFIDPTENLIRAGKITADLPGKVIRGVNAAATSVPMEYYRLAAKAGNSPLSKEGRAFARVHLGKSSPTDLQLDMQKAYGQISGANKDAHNATLAKAAANGAQPDYDTILSAIQAERDRVVPGGVPTKQFGETQKALDAFEQDVLDHKAAQQATDAAGAPLYPSHQGPLAIDNLKKGLWDTIQSTSNADARSALNKVYHEGVKRSLADAVPGYQDIMDTAQGNINRLKDVSQSLGVHGRGAASGALRKSLKQAKTETGKGLLDELAKVDPTIPYSLAGHGTSELGTHGLINTLLAIPATSALGPVGALAPFAASSPKLLAIGHYAAGAAGSAARQATRLGRAATYPAQALSGTGPADGSEAPDPTAPAAPAAPAASGDANVAAALRGTEGTARNPNSSATGPFQYLADSFVDDVKKYHPEIASKMSDAQIKSMHGTPQGDQLQDDMGPKRTADDAKMLQGMGIPATPGRLKLMHVLGKSGGARLFSADPNAPAEKVISPAAINANRSIFAGKTAGEIQQWAEGLMQNELSRLQQRTGRASGGKVGGDRHEYLVARLMKAAKDAKKATDKTTEPLLKVPDAHIVKALDVAQRAI